MKGREDQDIVKAALKAYSDELFAATIYSELADMYRGDKTLSSRLKAISEMEKRHALFWRRFLENKGISVSGIRVSRLKVGFLKALSRIIGPGFILKMLESGEGDAVKHYSAILSTAELEDDERREVQRILEDELLHEHELEEESSRFKEFMDHVRDAVLGMSDGLVEVLSVAAGLAGAYGDPFYVAVGGAIVGVGGALSMGIGAFTSVRAQNQVRLSVLSRIRLASRHAAGVLKRRIVEYMARRGVSRRTSEMLAEEAASNPELMGSIIAEEEYGLSEASLENPAKAGLYTGLFYAVGAVVPLLPYFARMRITYATPLSFILAGIMLAATGFIIAVSAGLNYKYKMIELAAAGLGSAALTFLIGKAASIILGINIG